jgi:transposase InsO family protein
MSESFLEDGNARTGEQPKTDEGVRVPEAREPNYGVEGSEASVTGSVREQAQDPPYPPTCRPEFTPPAAGGQDEVDGQAPAFLDERVADLPELPVENVSAPRLTGRGVRRKRAVLDGVPAVAPRVAPENLTPEQRLLLLDTWQRSKLPASDFAAMVGISKHTLYTWKWKFEEQGPGGLVDRPRGGPKGSKLPELTKRTILMLKQANPDWGCQRISDMLVRGPGLAASASSVARILVEAGYELHEEPTRPHPDKVRSFERARPNQLWQTDLFTFILKRQNRRVYLVAFMDDHSRFIVSYGLHASQSTALVLEVLRAGLTSYPAPEEILTDNGTQYVTWRGKSQFSRELEKRGIKQVVSRPRHPQTLGKIERFWGTLWKECIEAAVFLDLGDAQRRIGLFIDHYNFQRPHQGIDGLVPADRYFGAAAEVLKTLRMRVAANALELARHGVPKQPLYLTGQVGGQPVSIHAEGERVIVTGPQGGRQEVDLAVPQPKSELPEPLCPAGAVASGFVEQGEPAPGTSPLDEGLRRITESFESEQGGAS